MRRVARFAVGLVLLGILSACTIEPSDLEATEEEYLEQVEDVLRPLRQTTSTFEELRKTTNKERYIDGLKDIPVAARWVRIFREMDDITAPPRFFADQRRTMRAIADIVPDARAAEQLADAEDVVKATARFAHTVVLYERTLLEDQSRFCIVAATSAAERDLCDPIGILPGAAYGDRLHAILARASAEFTPRGFFFVSQSFTNEEVARYLQSIGPSLVDGVEQARDDIRKLIPPDEFASDHRVLEEYFTDVSRVSQQIADAANDNPARLRRLFPESQRIVRQASSSLSENIRPATDVWFRPSGGD